MGDVKIAKVKSLLDAHALGSLLLSNSIQYTIHRKKKFQVRVDEADKEAALKVIEGWIDNGKV